jgi:hypothetical protein
MKIFVVQTAGEEVDGVFDTKEKAEAYIVSLKSKGWSCEHTIIEEFILNEGV